MSHFVEGGVGNMPGSDDSKPMFETGKRYRLKNGMATGPLIRNSHTVFPLCAGVNGMVGSVTWTEDGRYSSIGHRPEYDLMPGAIEDEQSAVDPHCVLQAQISYLDLTLQNAMESGEAQIEDLRRQLRSSRETARAQESVIASMAAKIEAMDSAQETFLKVQTSHADAIEQLQRDTIDRNDRELRAAHDAIVAKAVDRLARGTKPTIKVGWVNVYRNNRANAIHETRKDADSCASAGRIACIQIPDITEGEGL